MTDRLFRHLQRPAGTRSRAFFFLAAHVPALSLTPFSVAYRSSSAATTLMLPRIATTSLTRCPSVSFAIAE